MFEAQDFRTTDLMHHYRFAFHNDSVSTRTPKEPGETSDYNPAAVLLDCGRFVTAGSTCATGTVVRRSLSDIMQLGRIRHLPVLEMTACGLPES